MPLLSGYILAISLLLLGMLLLRYLVIKKHISALQDQIVEKTKKIRQLHLEILRSEDNHRQYIATEFHDRVVQYLGMAKNKLTLVQKQFGDSNTDLTDITELIKISLKETRSLIKEINPPILHESGFGAAIVSVAHQICENNDIDVKINNLIGASHSTNIDRETKTILFQSTRELLNNVIKHAKADNVSVEVWSERDFVWIKITDDGIGIFSNDSISNDREGGYGLSNIKYRIEQLDGEFDIYSNPGYGTTVKLGAPFHLNDDKIEL